MKTRVYDLSRYANREREVIPRETLEKPPSAELRPEQRDTDSLPPYDVLDPILEAYVERYCSADRLQRSRRLTLGWCGRSCSWWSGASTSGSRLLRC